MREATSCGERALDLRRHRRDEGGQRDLRERVALADQDDVEVELPRGLAGRGEVRDHAVTGGQGRDLARRAGFPFESTFTLMPCASTASTVWMTHAISPGWTARAQ